MPVRPLAVTPPSMGASSTKVTKAARSASLRAGAMPEVVAGVAAVVLAIGLDLLDLGEGLPSRPVGRKISTTTRIPKAATSLYCRLK